MGRRGRCWRQGLVGEDRPDERDQQCPFEQYDQGPRDVTLCARPGDRYPQTYGDETDYKETAENQGHCYLPGPRPRSLAQSDFQHYKGSPASYRGSMTAYS
jgi:hypothetical protein